MPDHYDLETFRRRHFAYQAGHHVADQADEDQADEPEPPA
jgi:hypothetical protein